MSKEIKNTAPVFLLRKNEFLDSKFSIRKYQM